jgi:hypothetical protein
MSEKKSNEQRMKKHDEDMVKPATSPDKFAGDDRVIAGYPPVWIQRVKRKKDPKEKDSFELRNIFALNHAEFRAFSYDMLSQTFEKINALERELGQLAIRMIKTMPVPEQKPAAPPSDDTADEEVKEKDAKNEGTPS